MSIKPDQNIGIYSHREGELWFRRGSGTLMYIRPNPEGDFIIYCHNERVLAENGYVNNQPVHAAQLPYIDLQEFFEYGNVLVNDGRVAYLWMDGKWVRM